MLAHAFVPAAKIVDSILAFACLNVKFPGVTP